MNTPPPPQSNLSITLDEARLHQVWLSSEHILLHLDDLTAVESVCQDLWDIGKQLKHYHHIDNNDNNNVYRKAMLWMIYHCRSSIAYRQQEWAKTIHACQTCLAIDLSAPPPSLSDSLLLQKVGLIQVQAQPQTSSMLEQCLNYQQHQQRPRSSSLTGSTISDASDDSAGLVMMVCSLCAVKKRAMPVCAQCKSQRYCGIKCLKLDKDRHSSLCCLQR
ncbi:unnamed protein product [Absidia cylindrospora]